MAAVWGLPTIRLAFGVAYSKDPDSLGVQTGRHMSRMQLLLSLAVLRRVTTKARILTSPSLIDDSCSSFAGLLLKRGID